MGAAVQSGTRSGRYLFVDHTAQMGGAEIALVRLIRERQFDSVEVIVFEDGPMVEALRALGVAVAIVPADKFGVRGRRALAKAVKGKKYDAVIANSLDAAAAMSFVAVDRAKRVIYLREGLQWLSPRRRALMGATAFRNADAVLANSEWTNSTRFGRLKRLPSRVVYTNSGIASAARRVASRDPGQPLRVISLSRIVPWKGIHMILDALEHTPSLADPAKLRITILGANVLCDRNYQDDLMERAAAFGDVIEFREHTNDVEAYLGEADVLLHLSINEEPLGQVVVQGLASDLVLLTTATGGAAELVAGSFNGMTVTPDNAGELAEALGRLCDDDALVDSLRKTVSRSLVELTDERVASNIHAALREFVGA